MPTWRHLTCSDIFGNPCGYRSEVQQTLMFYFLAHLSIKRPFLGIVRNPKIPQKDGKVFSAKRKWKVKSDWNHLRYLLCGVGIGLFLDSELPQTWMAPAARIDFTSTRTWRYINLPCFTTIKMELSRWYEHPELVIYYVTSDIDMSKSKTSS